MDRADAIRAVAEMVKGGAGVAEIMPKAIDLCQEIEASESWRQVRAIDWTGSLVESQIWFTGLLGASPPPPSITGFWFGIFNPIRTDEPLSDFYVLGSAKYPEEEWFFEQDWRPEARYATSQAQAEIYRRGLAGGAEVGSIADYVLTFAHAAATVNDLVSTTDRGLLLGGSAVKGIAVGHDSGDALFLGEVTAQGVDRSKSDWV